MAETRNGSELVWMRHPETGGVQEVRLDALETLWKSKGWVEDATVDRAQVEHERRLREILGGEGMTVEGLQDATKLTLVEVAGQLGRSVEKGATKDQLLKTITAPVSPEDGSTTTAQK